MRLPVMLFLLALVSICAASETVCPPQCRKASQQQDVPTDIILTQQGLTSMGDIPLNAWLVCDGINGTTGTDNPASTPTIPCMSASKSIVAIIGYPFGLLLTRSIASYSRTIVLALVKCEITDIEDNALTGLVSMGRLDLRYNRLVHVKQGWFSGLKHLASLALSSNQIVRVDPGCFSDLANLHYLYMNDNLVRKVQPDWFLGLNKLNELNLESNCIEIIAAGTFQHLNKLYRLSLAGNSLQYLDGGTFWGLDSVIVLGSIAAGSETVPDTKAQNMALSLALGNSYGFSFFEGQDVSVKVSDFILCVRNGRHNSEQTFSWTFDSRKTHDYHTSQYHIKPCSSWGIYSQQITSQAPFVVMIQQGSPDQHNDDNSRCRQAWGNVGLTMAIVGGLQLRFVSFWEGNAEKETLAIAFDQTQQTDAGSNDSISVTCFLLKTDSSSRLVLDVNEARNMLNKTHSDPYGVCKEHADGLTSQRTPGRSNVFPRQQTRMTWEQTTLSGHHTTMAWQQTTLPGQQTTVAWQQTTSPPTSTILDIPAQEELIPIHLVVLVVLLPMLAFTFVLLLKKCIFVSDNHLDIHVNEPRVAVVSRRVRPASVPATSRVLNRSVSSRSLPISLSTKEPVYCEILDESISAAQRPLPALPPTYSEIPDNIPDVARSTSLPSLNTPKKKDQELGVSCRSLPASLRAIESTLCEFGEDNDDQLLFYAAATDLTLPVINQNGERGNTCVYNDGDRRQNWERHSICVYSDGVLRQKGERRSTRIYHDGVVRRRGERHSICVYSDGVLRQKGERRSTRIYHDGVVRRRGQPRNICVYNDSVDRPKRERRSICIYHDGVAKNLHSHKYSPSGRLDVYGRGIADKSHRVRFYGNVEEAFHGTRGVTALVSSRDQGTRTYLNTRLGHETPTSHGVTSTTDGCMSHSGEGITNCTYTSLPNLCGPFQVNEDNGSGCRMKRACSQPALQNPSEESLVSTQPNNYWPYWQMVEDKVLKVKLSRSLPVLLTDSSDVSQSEAICTLSVAYGPWDVIKVGRNRSRERRASLPSLLTPM
ncbi:hypothetical protein Bbelb_084290 [Branchiostoma belcheri]|nr:hypothetical protein Bbelb_084290 [Branchiostoma belcheri]